ncbi:MAG: CatA-like O-acetyltransferase, partial [Anaerolineales bacterium]
HPSCTILVEHDLFSFCSFTYTEDFPKFAAHAQDQIDLVQRDPWIKNDSDNDAQLFMTAIPWASFTSFMHPLNHPVDSIPRFAWGKYFQEGDQIKMPLSVQGHHALMDGLHIGHYFQLIQEHLYNPEFI